MKMKILATAATAITLTTGIVASNVAWAEQDFSQYSNEELVQQRTQVRDMSEGDRALFRAEMQQRAQTMSAEERAQLGIDGRGQSPQDGQPRQRSNEDNDTGQGTLQRERTRSAGGDGYGSGYGSRQGGNGGSNAGGFGGGRGAGGGGGGRDR